MNQHSIDNLINLFLKREKINDIPVAIEDIAKKYASIEYIESPISFDGITIKERGKKSKIILFSDNYHQRIKFTIAHELGHIIIPWHVGKIVDEEIFGIEDVYDEYHEMEIEANRFAAGILLPIEPVKERFNQLFNIENIKLADVVEEISEIADVSLQATIYKLIKIFPSGCAYFYVNSDRVIEESGHSPGTYTRIPSRGDHFSLSIFRSVEHEYSKILRGNIKIYFLQFDEDVDTLDFTYEENPIWKDLLFEILKDKCSDEKEVKKMYKSINSVIGGCFGIIKNKGYNYNDLANHLHERLVRKEYNWIVEHDQYLEFMSAKTSDLFNKIN
jgi:Zn-dependent peptidase ImmA (M78 family)